MSESRAPSADRLIFMAAEHSLRKGQAGAGSAFAASPPDSDIAPGRIKAHWILTPSVALTQDRFRIWSPVSPNGVFELLSGLLKNLDHSLGILPLLRRWRSEARSNAGARHGKSRLRDLVELAIHEPVLTSTRCREMLGASRRAAIYLMAEAEAAGILTRITPRRSHCIWATPIWPKFCACWRAGAKR